MNYLGIDLGTSSVKLLLMDEGGAILRTVSKSYPVSMPQEGWAEQEPELWWQQTVAGVMDVMNGVNPATLAGISFGGQMHGLVLLDKYDKVIRPAILWNDGRTKEETDYLNDVIGTDRLTRCTANIAFAGFTAPKLLWVRNNEPANFERIHKIMLPKDYIAYKMTGVHSSDYSDASGTLLLDVANKRWSEEMLRICGISPEQLPGLFESAAMAGTLRPSAAGALGLPSSVSIIAGAGDNAAAAVGTGTVKNGACNISLGTSGTVFIAMDEFRLPENNTIHSFAHATGKYHLLGCVLSAAACNRWWIENVLRASDYKIEESGFVPNGTNTVRFAPYLMGERSPHNDPLVRGAFLGLSMSTSRGQMTQAIMEGVGFAIRESVEIAGALGMDIQKTRICGGGARSPVWRQIIADILRMPVETIATGEGPGLGAAMLAAVGCGAYDSVEQITDAVVKVANMTAPEPAASDRYDESFDQFRRIYPSLKALT